MDGKDVPAGVVGRLEVVVEPPEQDLIRRQPQKLFQRLAVVQQAVQFRVDLDVDLAEQAPTDNLPNETENQVFSSFFDIGRADIDD